MAWQNLGKLLKALGKNEVNVLEYKGNILCNWNLNETALEM